MQLTRALLALIPCLAACIVDVGEDEDYGPALDIEPSELPDPDAVLPGLGKADGTGTTDCTSTVHIGDSLSAYTLPALRREYEEHGVTHLVTSAGGGRAILQKMPADEETGLDAAKRIKRTGFTGCWVIALGTNDTANIARGTRYTRDDAIDRLMTEIDSTEKARVLWVNTYTLKPGGYWATTNMFKWNAALEAAKRRWPNLVVFDWAKQAAASRGWYSSDLIHHNTLGNTHRNRAIADALATTFPAR